MKCQLYFVFIDRRVISIQNEDTGRCIFAERKVVIPYHLKISFTLSVVDIFSDETIPWPELMARMLFIFKERVLSKAEF